MAKVMGLIFSLLDVASFVSDFFSLQRNRGVNHQANNYHLSFKKASQYGIYCVRQETYLFHETELQVSKLECTLSVYKLITHLQ